MRNSIIVLVATLALAYSMPAREVSNNDEVSVLVNGDPEDIPQDLLNLDINEYSNGKFVKSEQILPVEKAVPVVPDVINVPEEVPIGIMPMPAEIPHEIVHIPAILPSPIMPLLPEIPHEIISIPEINLHGPVIALPQEIPSGIVALPAEIPHEIVALPEEIPSGIVALPEEIPSGIVALPEEIPSGIVALPEEIPSGIVALPEEIPHEIVALPEEIPSGIVALPAETPNNGLLYNSDGVQVSINPADEGYLSSIKSWFSMIVNKFSGSHVETHVVV